MKKKEILKGCNTLVSTLPDLIDTIISENTSENIRALEKVLVDLRNLYDVNFDKRQTIITEGVKDKIGIKNNDTDYEDIDCVFDVDIGVAKITSYLSISDIVNLQKKLDEFVKYRVISNRTQEIIDDIDDEKEHYVFDELKSHIMDDYFKLS